MGEIVVGDIFAFVPVMITRRVDLTLSKELLQQVASDCLWRSARNMRRDYDSGYDRDWTERGYYAALTINWEVILDDQRIAQHSQLLGPSWAMRKESFHVADDLEYVEYTPEQFSELIGLPLSFPSWEEVSHPDFLNEDKRAEP